MAAIFKKPKSTCKAPPNRKVKTMIPIALSMTGSGERWHSALFMGWFGPRGLASIVFAIMVLHEELPGSELIGTVVTCTVAVSLIVHGMSANPLSRWIGRREQATSAAQPDQPR